MPDDPELKRIIANGIAKGYSDEDILLLTQEHKRRQTAGASMPPAREKDFGDWIEQDLQRGVADLYTGVAKGVGSTLFGLGKIARDYTPIGRISDAIAPGTFDERPKALQPTGTMQRIGFTGEQMGEFFLPTGAVGKVGAAAEVGKAAVLTKAQTGSTGDAAVSGALTAALPPVIGAVGKLAKVARGSAEKSVAQALGATKEAMKAEAAKLAPQILDRGVKGSRAGMLAQASSQVSSLNTLVGQEVQRAARSGAVVDGLVVRGAVQLSADALKVKNAAGKLIPIPGTEKAIKQLEKLDTFVEALGPDVPFDKAQRIKVVWDHIVSKAGLYGNKVSARPTDQAVATSIRDAAGAFRELLAQGSPTLADLNTELSFWKGLRKVLAETERRTQAQSGGIVAAGSGGAGAIVGALSGDSASDRVQNAVLGGLAGRQLVKGMQSAWWRTSVSGPLKNALAAALATGSTAEVQRVAAKIAAAVPAVAH